MSNHPIIKALKEELENDFKIGLEKAKKCCDQCYRQMNEQKIYFQYGHEAASARLIPLIEKAIKLAEFYDCRYIFDEDDDDGEILKHDKPWRYYSGKKAREFLLSVSETADASGEMNKDGE